MPRVLALIALAVLLPVTVFVIGIRSGDPRFVRAMTRFQRDVVNPRVLATAGTPGSPWAVVEHVGRRTGTGYETPVGAVRDGDGWVISLPYGEQTSWVRNVVSAGEAHLRVDGERRRVGEIAIVPIIRTRLARQDAVAIRILGIRHALILRDLSD